MSAPTSLSPSTVVTEVPGRFCPIYIVDKRSPGTISSSTTTGCQLAFLPRTETVDSTFNTPVTPVDELGTNLHAGSYDDLPDAKLNVSSYDTGAGTVLSLLTNKKVSGTTTYGPSDFANATVDMVRQFADPNGNVFASVFQRDLVIEEFGASLKTKSLAMETYSLTGFNLMKFRGYIITKAYVIQSADVTAGNFNYAALLGADEAPVVLPAPTGSQPPSYWQQIGCIRFLKIEKYHAGTGWQTFTETSGTPSTGQVKTTGLTPGTFTFASGDLNTGDVVLFTFCSYGCDALVGGNSIKTIYQSTPDTSDPTCIPTRLTPFTISANTVPRGQSLDLKLSLKRERAEGIGDVTGVYGPPAAPEVSVSLEVKQTDFSFNAVLESGSPTPGGNADFYDPNYITREQLTTAVPLVATLYDPRNVGTKLKSYTVPSIVLNNENDNITTKNAVTRKFTGIEQFGNLVVTVNPA